MRVNEGGRVEDARLNELVLLGIVSQDYQKLKMGQIMPAGWRASGYSPRSSEFQVCPGDWAFFRSLLVNPLTEWFCPLPEGDLKVAHPFKGGVVQRGSPVPKGRLNHAHNRGRFEGFSRPFGTCAISDVNPAVNCRAIVKSPSGRWGCRVVRWQPENRAMSEGPWNNQKVGRLEVLPHTKFGILRCGGDARMHPAGRASRRGFCRHAV